MISIVCCLDGQSFDIVIPEDISADALISAVSQVFHPKKEVPECLRCDNPITLLSGNMSVSEFGLHDGSAIYV